jgi:hypothetical protein
MSSWTWYRVALARPDVSENVLSPFLKMETVRSPKGRVELVLHGTKSMQTSLINAEEVHEKLKLIQVAATAKLFPVTVICAVVQRANKSEYQ